MKTDRKLPLSTLVTTQSQTPPLILTAFEKENLTSKLQQKWYCMICVCIKRN